MRSRLGPRIIFAEKDVNSNDSVVTTRPGLYSTMALKQGKVVALLATLILGGVLAPLSHFVYMATADTAVHHSEAHHQLPGADEGATLVEPTSNVEPCSYADLFATQMAGDTPPAESFVAPDLVVNEFSEPSDVRSGLSFTTLTIRGPPASLVAVS